MDLEKPLRSYMLKVFLPALSLFALFNPLKASKTDSLKNEIKKAKSPARQLQLWELLIQEYGNTTDVKNFNAAVYNYLAVAIHSKNDSAQMVAYLTLGSVSESTGDFRNALDYLYRALHIAEKRKDTVGICQSAETIAVIYKQIPNATQSLHYLNMAQNYLAHPFIRDSYLPRGVYANKAEAFAFLTNQPDSAFLYATLAERVLHKEWDTFGYARLQMIFGKLYTEIKAFKKAENYFLAGIRYADSTQDKINLIENLRAFAELKLAQNQPEEAQKLAKRALNEDSLFSSKPGTLSIETTDLLSRIFHQLGKDDSAYIYSVLNKKFREKLLNNQKLNDIENLTYSQKVLTLREEQQKLDAENAQKLTTQKWIRNGAFIVVALVVLLAGFLIYQARLRRRIEMERMRNRLSRDLHDDIGSTLSSINILSRVAKNTVENNERDRAIESLEKINERSQRLLLNMSDLVWKMNPTNDTLEEVMSRMREYAVSILEAKDILFTLDFPKDQTHIKLPMEVKNNLYLIFKEAVNNLAKYSDCTNAQMIMRFDNNILSLQISDNGKGFDQAELTHQGGLVNMKMRAEEMKADLHISSTPGVGTEIKLHFLLPSS